MKTNKMTPILLSTVVLTLGHLHASTGMNDRIEELFNINKKKDVLLKKIPALNEVEEQVTRFSPYHHLFKSGDYGAGNGGDSCEARIKEIRSDLETWINTGGAKNLVLPKELSVSEYETTMLESIRTGLITCTNSEIKVGVSTKTCRNFDDKSNKKIIECNSSMFFSSSEDDQYRLIHHEFAGLAGVEVNENTGLHYEESNYDISNQIAAFLDYKKIKKLSVQSCSSANIDTKRESKVESFFVSQANAEVSNNVKDVINNLEVWQGVPMHLSSQGDLTIKSINVIETHSEYSYVADELRSYQVFLKLNQPSRPIHADSYLGNYLRQSTLIFTCELTSSSPCDENVKITCKL